MKKIYSFNTFVSVEEMTKKEAYEKGVISEIVSDANDEDGYCAYLENDVNVSFWLSDNEFKKKCREMGKFTFPLAFELLNAGYIVAQNNWPLGSWVQLIKDKEGTHMVLYINGELKNNDWMPTVKDMLANNWVLTYNPFEESKWKDKD